MNISVFWARVLGFYAVIVSISAFYYDKNYQLLIEELEKNPPFLILTVLFTLFIGLSIAVSHSIWKGWPIIVTLLGYWISLKGILLLFPKWLSFIMHFWQTTSHYTHILPSLIIGLILLFCGYFLKVKAS